MGNKILQYRKPPNDNFRMKVCDRITKIKLGGVKEEK